LDLCVDGDVLMSKRSGVQQFPVLGQWLQWTACWKPCVHCVPGDSVTDCESLREPSVKTNSSGDCGPSDTWRNGRTLHTHQSHVCGTARDRYLHSEHSPFHSFLQSRQSRWVVFLQAVEGNGPPPLHPWQAQRIRAFFLARWISGACISMLESVFWMKAADRGKASWQGISSDCCTGQGELSESMSSLPC
jgi:hypothetical protein